MKERAVVFALVFVLSNALLAAAESPENARLLALGKLWATIKYFHPYLGYQGRDWDKTFVEALPAIRAAKTKAEYAAAVQSMLDRSLHDPGTYVISETPSSAPASLKIETSPDGTLVVSQTPGQAGPDEAERLAKAIQISKNIVFDLRSASSSPNHLSRFLDVDRVARELPLAGVAAPGQRKWIHYGFAPEIGSRNADFYSAFQLVPGPRIPQVDPPGPQHKILFILDETSRLPRVGCALFAAGGAEVWAESSKYQCDCAETVPVDIGEGARVIVRLSQPVSSRSVTIAPSRDIVPLALAALVKSANGPPPNPPELAFSPSPQSDEYPQARYPPTEYRILAAYKIWAVFHYFFAYRDLMDEDWDDVFASFLPKIVEAKDAKEYNLSIAELLSHTADSQSTVQSDELTSYFGAAPVGLRLRLVERKPLITEILDPEAAKLGIRVGDIISKVDGESIVDRFNRESPYVAASTSQSHGFLVIQKILNGPEGSAADLVIGGQDGRTRQISLKRSSTYVAALQSQRTADAVKLLAGNLGYVDLDRLMADDTDAMFAKLRGTKAIIFDIRGSAHQTAGAIAPRLTDQKDVAAAIFTGPLVLGPDLPRGETLTSNASYFFVQRLPEIENWKYKGRTVALIDERTIGDAEHIGLFLEVANKTEFIGTPSAGADGDVTNFVVPGGITISFSGHDIRHANGGKLQRLGFQPSQNIAPTIEGIRKGRDEVLDKALSYLLKN